MSMTTEAMEEVVVSQSGPNGIAVESNDARSGDGEVDAPTEKKRARSSTPHGDGTSIKRVKGVAPIKAECVAWNFLRP